MQAAVVVLALYLLAEGGAVQSDPCHYIEHAEALNKLHWSEKNWVLAFRLTAGTGKSAYDNYMDNAIDDDHPLARIFLPPGCLEHHGHCDRHYHSALLNHWPSDHVDQVRVTLYEGNKEVAYLLFNGKGSDKTSWFSKGRLISSSWKDLWRQNQNFFSIEGHFSHFISNRHSRRFYIFRNYGGCPVDQGWLSVQDQRHDACDWGKVTSFPAILYSSSSTYTKFNSRRYLKKADVLTITLKLKIPC